MTEKYDLTTESGLHAYLASKDQHPSSISLLSGGTANYVYRVTSQNTSTSIYKHAAPYLHSNKSFAFDPTRMNYEARALELVSALSTTSVSAVHLLNYDAPAKLLRLSDGGPLTLKEAYTDPSLDVAQIGSNLAHWLANLHASTTATSLALSSAAREKNNPIAVAIYRYSYAQLHTALAAFGHDVALAHGVDEQFGRLLASDDECVCHGDFWPGNVLVLGTCGDNETKRETQLTVVDFEMTRRGTSATDVAQFAAEAFLLDTFRAPCRGLLYAFIRAYFGAREGSVVLGKEWLRRMVVHYAVHITFWPTKVAWVKGKTVEEVEEAEQDEDEWGSRRLVDLGMELLKAVLDDDWENVLQNRLLTAIKGLLEPMLSRS